MIRTSAIPTKTKESVEYGTSKDIPENACRSYATQINAKNPDNIFITVLEQVLG